MRRRHLLPGLFLIALDIGFAQPPQRIISISPSVTEMLYGIGAFPRVVAVSAVFRNALAALLEFHRMVTEEELRLALVIGMSVGFVHVVERKRELMALDRPMNRYRSSARRQYARCGHHSCAL